MKYFYFVCHFCLGCNNLSMLYIFFFFLQKPSNIPVPSAMYGITLLDKSKTLSYQ